MIGLHQLAPHQRTPRKRIGRGHGSGQGTFAGKGTKGQRSRTGGRRGMMRRSLKALIEHLPKVRGGSLTKPQKPQTVSLTDLERSFAAGERVSRATLVSKGLLPHHQELVVFLGDGKLSKALTVEAHRCSRSAREAIAHAGGKVVLQPRPETRRPRRRIHPH